MKNYKQQQSIAGFTKRLFAQREKYIKAALEPKSLMPADKTDRGIVKTKFKGARNEKVYKL